MAGEACTPGVIADWAPGRKFINAYGPSEDTVCSTMRPCAAGDRALIGRPIANTEAYVVNQFGGLAPLGVPGELWVGGIGVARGYWDRPQLTAERFVENRFGGTGRLYRTGDIVRRLPDGELEFLARIDHQVKVRGLRVELGEIESVLTAQPGVGAAIVLVHEIAQMTRPSSVTARPPAKPGWIRLRCARHAASFCRITWCRASWCSRRCL